MPRAEEMRNAHQTYVEGAERERMREAERRAQEERRRRDQVSNRPTLCQVLLKV